MIKIKTATEISKSSEKSNSTDYWLYKKYHIIKFHDKNFCNVCSLVVYK